MRTSLAGSRRLARIAKYSPAGPPPTIAILTAAPLLRRTGPDHMGWTAGGSLRSVGPARPVRDGRADEEEGIMGIHRTRRAAIAAATALVAAASITAAPAGAEAIDISLLSSRPDEVSG